MKKMRWIMTAMLTLIVMVCLFAGAPHAMADANLMENGSVVYAWINDPDELRNYIEDEGQYASYDYLQKDELSNVYKIVLDEPGQLIFAPLSTERTNIELYKLMLFRKNNYYFQKIIFYLIP